MQRLLEAQYEFSAYVLKETDQLPVGIKGNGLAPEQRLAIYRNNTELGLTEVLRDVYPVVNKLVGEPFFNRLAKVYLNQYPLHSACLFTFGEQLAEMITNFQPAQSLAYLPDVAKLEWYWHEAYHESDSVPLALATLAQLDPEEFNRIGFKLNPSARFLATKYPIAQIWASNQSDYVVDTQIDLNQGGCQLLIYRAELAVEIVSLEPADYQCLTALACGATFTDAIAQVMEVHPDFQVTACLQHWLHNGLLTEFFII